MLSEIVQKVKDNFYTIVFVLLGVFILFEAPIDPDFGWHYKYGEYITQNKRIPKENIYSYTFPEYKWANSYWISQVFFYLLYSNLGTVFSGILIAFLSTLVLFSILKKADNQYENGNKPTLRTYFGLFIALIFFSNYKAVVRPLLFSSFFMLLLIYALFYKQKYLKYTPLLFLIWVNTHADFAFGLAILGIFNIHKVLTKGLDKDYLLIYAASLISVVITIINPFGLELWQTLLKETNPFQFWHISEWLPLKDKNFMYMYYIFSAMVIASLIELKNKRENFWLIISYSIFFTISARASYFARIAFLSGLFPIFDFITNISKTTTEFFKGKNKKKIEKTSKYVLYTIFLVSGIIFTKKLIGAQKTKIWAKEAGYPYEAIQYIKENPHKFKGNMFNQYNWGGFLIWQLPEHKTFIDGRMPSWRQEDYSIFEEYIAITKEPEENYLLLQNYNIKWVLTKKDSSLSKTLIKKQWQPLFIGGNAIILKGNIR